MAFGSSRQLAWGVATAWLGLSLGCAAPTRPEVVTVAEGSLEAASAAATGSGPDTGLAQVDRAPWVPAPDEMRVAELELVDAVALGVETVSDGRRLLRLSQEPCRFVEAEPGAEFEADDPLGCRKYAYAELPARSHRALRVAAGPVAIEVSNVGVSHEVGLWLRREDGSATLVSSGGVAPGDRWTWNVVLDPGRYLYSCALNPTPAYLMVVE